jgi:hypothetical protein
VKPTRAGIQEIKYREQWTHDRFLQNELYDRQITEDDINNIPFPYLRSAIVRNRQEKQAPGRPFTIGFLLSLIFGGYQGQAAGITTAAPGVAPVTASTSPNPNTLSGRTRRPTKYKIKGNCKHPPKKHPKDSDDGGDSASDKETL